MWRGAKSGFEPSTEKGPGNKMLCREPGEAFGVRAYSAAFGWGKDVTVDCKLHARGKRRNTRALQTLRDFGYACRGSDLPARVCVCIKSLERTARSMGP